MADNYQELNGSNLTPELVFNLGFVADPTKVARIEFPESSSFQKVDPGRSVDPEYVVKIKVSDEAWTKVIRSREFLEEEAKTKTIYGVNTGFGANCKEKISETELATLQENLILSHSTGVGKPIPCSDVRMMLAMRISSVIKGYSGISKENVEKMVAAFNACCLSLVPEQGTVGASGDLAPLAHLVLGLMGKGEMWSPKTGVRDAAEVLKENNLTPLCLGMKEGLALINGTQFICAKGIEAFVRASFLARQADVVAALTLECVFGTNKAFDQRLHEVKPHQGQVDVARRMWKLLDRENRSESPEQVQDAYSLRCCPQVHGMVNDTLAFVEKILTTEINSVNDNPIVFAESGGVLSGGNFHGQYPAMALDFLAIAVNELANISERRIDRLVNKSSSEGLPGFLVKNSGVNSGFMIVQYCAASLVSEGKVLCHPASADSIPTCGGYEDHVSMGGFSARKAQQVVSNAEKVIAMELLSASQAVDLRNDTESKCKLKLSEPLEKIYNLVRSEVSYMETDRFISPDIEKVVKMIQERKVWQIAESYLN